MKNKALLLLLLVTIAGPIGGFAHDNVAAHGEASLYAHDFSAQPPPEMLEILRDGKSIPSADSDAIKALTARYLSRRSNRTGAVKQTLMSAGGNDGQTGISASQPEWRFVTTPFNSLEAFADTPFLLTSYTPPTGNGALMAASFGAFKPRVRFFWDGTTFYEESDNMPDNTMMPNLMVGITSWQQQVPLPAAYFASVTNPENTAGSLGYQQPNYWHLPLVPVPAASPITIFTPGSTTNNFQRGAIALASNGIAIFNPANNTGRVSYEIGELDAYGGHCGLADDYHYHIIPTHLNSRFGGPLGDDKPVAWGLDGYPIYGYLEPDGTPLVTNPALDSNGGGHDHGTWGFHYHARGTTTTDATHPYGTPQSPYTMNIFHGTVVNFGGQVDGQPEVGAIRSNPSGGYTASPVNGASIVAFKNPVALTTDGSGHLIENVSGTPSQDSYLMRVSIAGTNYDECWKINRNVTPRTLSITWRLAGATTTTTYTPGNATAIARLATYGMAAASQVKIPDTSQVTDTTATFGEDADYTINAQSFTDNLNGTITDNITGLMWQKTDNGESTWDTSIANASSVATGGFTDWRLPTPSELFSIFNHNNGNPVALNTIYFPSNSPAAEYWWTSDAYGTGANSTNVWCANSGGGLGGKPKSETISAGGAFRYHARYVRGTKPTNIHNYRNNGDGTITDLDSNLMWTQIPGPATTWDSALTYAENLSLGGFTDWRLPNIKELQTLTDYTLTTATSATNIKPSINRTAFGKTLTNCTTNGTTTVTCADTTGLVVGMPIVDPASIASTYISNTTVPTVTSVGTGTFTMSSAAIGSGTGLTLKALVRPTAYWSSTSLKGNPTTEAWLVETGINNAPTPPRNSQGIISYEVKTSSYPVVAVRSVPAGSISQGRATTTTANLFPAGQRVSAVGTITATDNSTWTVPSATQFNTAAKAPDLYNGYNAVTPADITAAQAAIAALPTKVIDADGEVVTGYIFSDNYFELYVNGVLVGVDPVPYTAFNSCVVKFKAKRPINYAVKLVDWEENLGLGTELSGPDAYHIGDGGFIASFSDGTVTNNQWKAQTFNIAPLDNPAQVVDLANGTHDSSAATTHTLTETAYALHYPVPSDWFSKTFSTAGWPNATTYTEAQVGVNNNPAYTNFPAQFSASGAQFIWSSNLLLDNEVIVRYTGPATAASQIAVEQPSGTGLSDGAGTVAYGNVNVGSTLSKTFVIRNTSGTAALSITGVTFDGTNGANFSVTTSPVGSIAASGSATMVVQFAPTAFGPKTAAVHIASSDTSVGTAFDVNLTGTGFIPPPTITSISTVPTVPSNTDTPILNATVTPASGATISSVKLSYNTGAQTTSTVFAETMSNTATTGTGGWDQTASPAVYPWTLVFTGGAGNIKQTSAANHTAAGQGGACGLEFGKGSATNSPPTSATTANAINATGTWVSGSTTTNYVEFYVAASNVASGQGWSFLLAPDGTNFGTARISETTGSVHSFTKYHYDLQSTDLVGTLKMQFQFFGNNVGGAGSSKVQIDDITVVTTSGATPATLDMTGPANGGIYTVQIPAPPNAGATVSYTITATDSNGSITTSTGSYTTGPAPAITTASLPGGVLSGAYSQTITASGGSGTGYTWSVVSGALPPNFTLTSAGVLSGTTTTAGMYNFTAQVTDSAGRISTKALSLTISTTTAPNVLIILTDDQGWADVGYHTAAGQVPVQTPNMDSLGASGIRLEKFYATTVCSVTRGCLLTGRNSLRTSVGNQKGLGLTEHLMPQTFKAAGYQTFMCGKWHMGGWDNNIYTTTMNGATIEVQQEGAEYLPHNRGWDFHKGQYGGAINYFTHTTSDPGKNNAVDWWQNGVQLLNDNTDLQGHGGYSTDLLADKAVEQIVNRDKAKPMLLYLAFNAIHAGVSAPQSYLNKYTALGVPAPRRTICAAVDCMDVAMGRVLAALDSEGITNNTLVVFMSDNGGDTTTGSLNSPLRGTKSDSYDGGLHTPAAIRWPGQLAAGVTSYQYVWIGDIFPTVCAAVGVTPQNTKPFDGVNLWPQLQSITAGSPNGAPRGVPLVTGDNGGPVALNLFTDPVNGGTKMFKLIRNPGTTVVNELFNLTDDPYETTDLLLGANAAAHSAIVTTLTSAITGIVTESYPPYIGISGITQTVAAGGNITLYAPFSAYKNAPTVQWKKGGVNITSSSPFYQATNSTGGNVAGVYVATLPLTNITPADAANYTVTVTNSNGTVTSPAGTLTVNTTPQQSWWFTNFGILAPTATGNAAMLADPEYDGLSNLAEWAFGLNPALSDGIGITLSGAAITKHGIPRLGTDGVSYSAMFGRRKDYVAAGLTYTVQFSADLSAWENSATTPTVIASDSEMEAVTVAFPALLGGGAKPRFFRVSVSTP